MKKLFLLAAVLFAAVPLFAETNWKAFASRMKDGDSFIVLSGTAPVEIRLWGIDCPESSQSFGGIAKEYSIRMVKGRELTISNIDIDQYGRTVAMVWTGTNCLNEELVRVGLAWVYKQYCKEPFLSKWTALQEAAMSEKRGLWAKEGAIPPWEFRKHPADVPQTNDLVGWAIILAVAVVILIIMRSIQKKNWPKKKNRKMGV